MLIAARNIFLSSAKKSSIINYLTFTAEEAGSTIGISYNIVSSSRPNFYLSYSTDGSTWNDFTLNTTVTLPNIGDVMYLKAKKGYTNKAFASASSYNKFVMTGKIAASGNIQTLINSDDIPDYIPQERCFNGLFYDCTALTQAPELPATTLANTCYASMFRNCTSLTQAPTLQVTTLTTDCYANMFNGCTSLTQAPELPATTLARGCYTCIFANCTSLTQAPELPATTLAGSCYLGMFSSCTKLTQAPELPVTTLANSCYYEMFKNCTSLTQAPALPATTLAASCYYFMFYGCTNLIKAPALPAETLADRCYYNMFKNCTKLNNINVNFSAWNPSNATENWVQNVASSGTFTCPTDLPKTYGVSYIPTSWTIKSSYQGLCFTAEQAGSTVKMSKSGSAPTVYLETSRTGEDGSWSDFTVGSTTITLANVGDKIYFRAKQDNQRFATSSSNYNMFVMTGKIAASGNINTLLKADGDIPNLTGRDYCYHYMFYNCASLTQAPTLPATTLANYCYRYMFRGCINLTKAPALPATTLASYCYQYMFSGCTNLTQAPELPATTLASGCYQRMFSGCSALTQAPELPATTLTDYCYSNMFRDCTSLTQAPELPATTLADYCYPHLFNGCTSLSSISINFTKWNTMDATTGWVSNVKSTGTFTCPADLPEEFGNNRIPTGWTVVRK